MLSFPRRRRGKDNRQLYSIPDITSFILVYQRDNHIVEFMSVEMQIRLRMSLLRVERKSLC